MPFKTISVVGLGYIGLPTAAMFASRGKNVIGVDVNQKIVDTINTGKIHIVEPRLDVMVSKAVDKGFLKATKFPEQADAFLISVPTPFLPVDKETSIPEPNLSYIEAAAKSIAKVLKKGDLVILESTSPVGATEQMAAWMAEVRPDITFPQTYGEDSDVRVAYCPERVLPGNVVGELVENDRVIGGMTEACSKAAIELYQIFVEGECIVTNARTAEMTKLTENASRDVSIAFANELSIICDELDINVWELIRLANRHPRVNILQPGAGVGGHCIAVDPWFIVSNTPKQARLIRTAREVNDSKPAWVINKIEMVIEDFLKSNQRRNVTDTTIACYGLSFKPDIDDLRESPALQIYMELERIHAGLTIAVEPNIKMHNSGDIKLVNFEEAMNLADIHVLLVDHYEFKKREIKSEYIIDAIGILQSNR